MKNILLIIIASYSFNLSFGQDLIGFRDDNSRLFGYKTDQGNIVIEPKYYSAYNFSEGLAGVCLKINGYYEKWGFINKKGEVIIPILKEDVRPFSEGLAAVKDENGWSYINSLNEKIISANSYSDVKSFFEGYAPVKKNDKWGYINKSGELKIVNQFYKAGFFKDGIAIVEEPWKEVDGFGSKYMETKKGFIDISGKLITGYNYTRAKDFENGYAIVSDDFKNNYYYFIIDKSGKAICSKTKYNKCRNFYEGLAAVGIKGKYGFIDANGNEIVKLKYSQVRDYNNGYCAVQNENEKWGFIDSKGNEISELVFSEVHDFSRFGFAYVNNVEYFGVLNKTGKLIFNRRDLKSLEYNIKASVFIAIDNTGNTFKFDIEGNEIK